MANKRERKNGKRKKRRCCLIGISFHLANLRMITRAFFLLSHVQTRKFSSPLCIHAPPKAPRRRTVSQVERWLLPTAMEVRRANLGVGSAAGQSPSALAFSNSVSRAGSAARDATCAQRSKESDGDARRRIQSQHDRDNNCTHTESTVRAEPSRRKSEILFLFFCCPISDSHLPMRRVCCRRG